MLENMDMVHNIFLGEQLILIMMFKGLPRKYEKTFKKNVLSVIYKG